MTPAGKINLPTQNVRTLRPSLIIVAQNIGAKAVKPEHLLLELERRDHGFGGAILRDHLRKQGISLKTFTEILIGGTKPPSGNNPVGYSQEMRAVFKLAQTLGEGYLGTGELLLATAILEGNNGRIQALGLNPDEIKTELQTRSGQLEHWRRALL